MSTIRIETASAYATLDPGSRAMTVCAYIEGPGAIRETQAFYGLDGEIDPDNPDVLDEHAWVALELATLDAVRRSQAQLANAP